MASAVDVLEVGEQGLDRRRAGHEPDLDFGTDPQCALGADEQPDEIVVGTIGPRQLEERAVRRDDG